MSRAGRGKAYGAVTIVNATATGIGCSLAVEAGAEATWSWAPAPPFRLEEAGIDDHLCKSVWTQARNALHIPGQGGRAAVRCAFPPSRGLKTSSSVAAALLRAAFDAAGAALGDEQAARLAVAASRDARVTLTGAYDDQVAVLRGGAHLTDNRAQRIEQTLKTKPWAVAVWVPDASITKSRLHGIDVSDAIPAAREAAELAGDGDLPAAMTVNGAAFLASYEKAGLPVDARPVAAARKAGALGAGLSGTGPAVAALFDAPVDLPAVPGGAWRWTRAVEATA